MLSATFTACWYWDKGVRFSRLRLAAPVTPPKVALGMKPRGLAAGYTWPTLKPTASRWLRLYSLSGTRSSSGRCVYPKRNSFTKVGEKMCVSRAATIVPNVMKVRRNCGQLALLVSMFMAFEVRSHAVEPARARLGHHLDVGAGHAPVLRLEVAQQDLHLGHRVHAHAGAQAGVGADVQHAHAVDGDIAGVVAIALHVDVEIAVQRVGVAVVHHAGVFRTGGLHGGALLGHGDGLGDLAHGQGDVAQDGLRHECGGSEEKNGQYGVSRLRPPSVPVSHCTTMEPWEQRSPNSSAF
jgi:hypothetical protein